MRHIPGILTWAVCSLAPVAVADEPGRTFQGEWRTTVGVVSLEQKGEAVTGSYGPGGRFLIKGTTKGNTLTIEFEEGNAKGDARFALDDSGNAFAGTFQVRNGQRGLWNGWRPDPKAASEKPISSTGLWLTDLGLADLVQDGVKVHGRYAARGNSTIEGTSTGRRLEFRFKSFRGGDGWFDFGSDGKSFTGASNADGFPGWFGWHGRKAPEFIRHATLEPGKIVDGSTQSLLTYAVRAPENYQTSSSHKWPAILILHGSNMNSRSYVGTIAATWPDIARDYIILGINGEMPSNLGNEPQFNYTYVNYVGRSTFKGFPGTDRESPALVSEAMAELKQVYPVSHYLVGGHSQGGFLTYSLLMNFPDSLAGAFPISCGVIFQCEPDAYADDTLRQAQRRVPLAIIHGKNDPVVGFTMGQYAATLFGEAGWPAFRFYDDNHGAHMFARLPIGPAIRWLESHVSRDPTVLLNFAEMQLGEGRFRDTVAALAHARTLNLNDSQKHRADELEHLIDTKVSAGAAKYLALIRRAEDGSWIGGFLAFRDDFEFANAAHGVMTTFTELRARHDGPARTAFAEARRLFQEGKQDEGYAKYREIVQSYYASPLYRTVKRWLEERK
jgi:predicted esterase